MQFEKRKEKRFICPGTAYYSFSLEGDAVSYELPASCVNTSSSGMCIVTAEPLEQGRCISVMTLQDNKSSRDATVKWCRQIEGLVNPLYKVGVSFGCSSPAAA